MRLGTAIGEYSLAKGVEMVKHERQWNKAAGARGGVCASFAGRVSGNGGRTGRCVGILRLRIVLIAVQDAGLEPVSVGMAFSANVAALKNQFG